MEVSIWRRWNSISFSHCRQVLALLAICLFTQPSGAYSVLTHEQVVDLLWNDQIRPILLKRFPGSTEDQLRQAHAYAYGGCVLQDMGYYPFGNKYFSDLVHYVRTGDFVEALLRDASDLNEYAFALGALAHYASDNSGHPVINKVVAIEFPKLRAKYGDKVTYAEDPKAHIRTEFGFDMVQVAKNRYTSDHYHDFIGFEVAKPLMERSFQETYSLRLEDVFGDLDLAIGTYRRSVSKLIPQLTRVALLSRHDELVRETPNFSKEKFLYSLSRTGYEKEWGTVYRKPGFGARMLSILLKIIPKIGPFATVDFKIPTTQTEDMYIKSVNTTVESYGHQLRTLDASGHLDLANLDCDTGADVALGEYELADKTYAKLVEDLAKKKFDQISPELRADLLHFYAPANVSTRIKTADKKEQKALKKTMEQVEKLKVQTVTASTANRS
ncbi:MAG TPA: zinc dependent phospholipase C family protein [Terriglobales bacterium]|jgi:hypothetical protein